MSSSMSFENIKNWVSQNLSYMSPTEQHSQSVTILCFLSDHHGLVQPSVGHIPGPSVCTSPPADPRRAQSLKIKKKSRKSLFNIKEILYREGSKYRIRWEGYGREDDTFEYKSCARSASARQLFLDFEKGFSVRKNNFAKKHFA